MATNQLKSLSKLVNIPIKSHQDELYLIRLASMSLRELQEEPDRLEEQQNQMEQDVKKKVYDHNDIFIKSQDCFTDIHHNLNKLSKDISDSYNVLPSLQYTCKKFSDKANDLIKQHQKNKKTLRYHSQLLELLEMPQLIDTCVKNGLYDEALILLSQCKKLTTIHTLDEKDSPETPGYGASLLIHKIWNEMKQVTITEQQMIWKELEGELQLQRAITLIRLLTKINEYLRPNDVENLEFVKLNEEREMRKHFLQARTEYFNRKLSIYSKYDSGLYLKEYIDLCRDLWMNTITQYVSIFLMNETATTPLSPSSELFNSLFQDSNPNTMLTNASTQDIIYNLHEWCTNQFDMFIETLNMYMYKITSGPVMLQVMKQGLYLCDSITNIHCDYRSILIGVYSKAIQTLMKKFTMISFIKYWTVCVSEFTDNVVSPSFWSKPLYTSNLYKLKDPFTYFKYYLNSNDYYKMIPPSYLMDIPILSKLFNDFISSFNELRYCAIKGQGLFICQSMTDHVLQVCTSLLNAKNILKSILVPRSSTEGYVPIPDHFEVICLQFYCTILPLLNYYLQTMFHINSPFIEIDKIRAFYVENELCELPDQLNPLTYVPPTTVVPNPVVNEEQKTEIPESSQIQQDEQVNPENSS